MHCPTPRTPWSSAEPGGPPPAEGEEADGRDPTPAQPAQNTHGEQTGEDGWNRRQEAACTLRQDDKKQRKSSSDVKNKHDTMTHPQEVRHLRCRRQRAEKATVRRSLPPSIHYRGSGAQFDVCGGPSFAGL